MGYHLRFEPYIELIDWLNFCLFRINNVDQSNAVHQLLIVWTKQLCDRYNGLIVSFVIFTGSSVPEKLDTW